MENSSFIENLQSTVMTGIYSSIHFIVQNRILFIIIYVIFLVSLVIRLHYTKKTMITIEKSFNQQLDTLRYQSSKILYQEKNNIHDYTNTIPLLLHNKSSYREQHKPYRSQIDKIIDEILYIGQLTNTTISLDQTKIQKTAWFCIKLHHTEQSIKNMITLLSLWLSKLFIQ